MMMIGALAFCIASLLQNVICGQIGDGLLSMMAQRCGPCSNASILPAGLLLLALPTHPSAAITTELLVLLLLLHLHGFGWPAGCICLPG